jgi:hypothetical protein
MENIRYLYLTGITRKFVLSYFGIKPHHLTINKIINIFFTGLQSDFVIFARINRNFAGKVIITPYLVEPKHHTPSTLVIPDLLLYENRKINIPLPFQSQYNRYIVSDQITIYGKRNCLLFFWKDAYLGKEEDEINIYTSELINLISKLAELFIRQHVLNLENSWLNAKEQGLLCDLIRLIDKFNLISRDQYYLKLEELINYLITEIIANRTSDNINYLLDILKKIRYDDINKNIDMKCALLRAFEWLSFIISSEGFSSNNNDLKEIKSLLKIDKINDDIMGYYKKIS